MLNLILTTALAATPASQFHVDLSMGAPSSPTTSPALEVEVGTERFAGFTSGVLAPDSGRFRLTGGFRYLPLKWLFLDMRVFGGTAQPFLYDSADFTGDSHIGGGGLLGVRWVFAEHVVLNVGVGGGAASVTGEQRTVTRTEVGMQQVNPDCVPSDGWQGVFANHCTMEPTYATQTTARTVTRLQPVLELQLSLGFRF